MKNIFFFFWNCCDFRIIFATRNKKKKSEPTDPTWEVRPSVKQFFVFFLAPNSNELVSFQPVWDRLNSLKECTLDDSCQVNQFTLSCHKSLFKMISLKFKAYGISKFGTVVSEPRLEPVSWLLTCTLSANKESLYFIKRSTRWFLCV